MEEGPNTPGTAGPVFLLRGALRWTGWISASCGVVLVGLVLVLQLDAVSTFAGRSLAAWLSPPVMEISVGEVSGSWVWGLKVTALRVSATPEGVNPGRPMTGDRSTPPASRGGGGAMGWTVRVDTLQLGYHLLALLKKNISFSWVDAAGLRVQLHSSTGDTLEGEKTESTPPDSTPEGGWTVLARSITLRNGEVRFRRGDPSPDTAASADPWILDHIALRARNLRIGPGIQLRLDSLDGRLQPSDFGSPPGRLLVAGTLNPEGLLLDTLALETRDSHLWARGGVPLAGSWPPAQGVELEVLAAPLLLRDLGPLLPSTIPDSLRITAQGTARTTDGALQLELEARSSGAGSLTLRGALAGPGRQGASTLSLQVDGLDLERWGASRAPRLVNLFLEARADTFSGPWSGEWRGRTRGVDVGGALNLTLRDPLGWQVEGRGSWDPSAGAPLIPAVDSTGVAVAFNGSGTGTAPGTLEARGELRLESGTLVGGLVDALVLTSEVASGEARYAVEGRVGGGALRGEGRITMPGVPDPRGRASFRLHDARYRQVSLDSLRLDLELRKGRGLFQGRMAFPDSARVSLAGSASPGSRGLEVQLDSLRFRELNLRAFTPSTDSTRVPPTSLSGSIQGGARSGAEGWTGGGTLQLDSSRAGRAPVHAGGLEVEVDREGGRVDLALRVGDGGLEGSGELSLGESRTRFNLPELRFWSLDVGALLNGEPGRTRLSGTLSGDLQGTELPELLGRLHLALDSAQVAGQHLTAGRLEAEIRDGRVQADLGMASMGTLLSATGEVGLETPGPSYRLQGSLAPEGDSGSPLFARFGVEGQGTRPDSLEARAWMVVDSARWRELTVEEGRLEARLAGGSLQLDTLVLESPAASVSAGGFLPIRAGGATPGELRLNGAVGRADLLADLLGAQLLAVGDARFQAAATGSLQDLDLSGEARVDALLLDQTRVQGIRLTARAHRSSDGTFDLGRGELLVDRLETSSLSVRRLEGEADLQAEGRQLAVRATALLDDSREGRLNFRVEELTAPSAVLLESLEFTADQDEWRLQRPTRIELAQGFELDSLAVEAGEQAVRAHGRVGREGPLTLAVELENFRIGTVSDLLGAPALQGRLSGSMALAGTGREPRMESSFQALLDSQRTPSSRVEVDAFYGQGLLEFRSRARVSESQGFRVNGTLPLHFSLADSARGVMEGEAFRVEARVDSLPLSWVGLFLSPDMVRDLRGSAHGSVLLQGSLEDPALEGRLGLGGVEMGLPILGVQYGDGGGQIRFQEKRILLDTLSFRSGNGTVSASGQVTMEVLHEPQLDLDLRAREFRAVASSGVNLVASGDLAVEGSPTEPRISGRVEVLRGDIYLDDLTTNPQVEQVALSEEDYQELARVFGYRRSGPFGPSPGIFQNAELDLEVDLRRDSWIRKRANPELAVQFSGGLSVQKAPGDSLRLVGEVSAVPERSYVEQFGRRFSLTRGDLVFQGMPLETALDLRAEYEVPSRDNPGNPEVTIALDITGTPDDLRLDLSSTPPLEASDMVSYLAVGRPADRGLGGGEGSLSQTGGALALGALSGAVEAYAREEVGLDVVEITTDGLEGVILLAGRYLSPELYLGIRQPVSLQRGSGEASEGRPEPEVEVELQAVRWLLLNLQAGGRAGVEFFVRSRIAYE